MRAIIIVEGLLCTDVVLRAHYRYSQSFNNLMNWNFFLLYFTDEATEAQSCSRSHSS